MIIEYRFDATLTVKATVGETSTYYTPERQGEAFAVDIPLPPGSGEVTTDLEINAVRFDSEQDLDLVKTVTGSCTTSGEAMTYDLDGNLLTWDGWTFTWNGENRLIKAEKSLLRVEADYDYLGRRFEKKVYHGETLTSHQRFLYDDYKLVEIRDALNANALETAYTWQPLQLDVPVAMKSGTAWGYYLFAGNKNITSLRAEDGTVLAEYHYGPFGQTLSATGPWAAVNPFRFSSEYHDAETNLVYYNYRHYSPALGRWLNRDPIEEQGGANLYGMVNNNPIKWWDKLGLSNPMIIDGSPGSFGYFPGNPTTTTGQQEQRIMRDAVRATRPPGNTSMSINISFLFGGHSFIVDGNGCWIYCISLTTTMFGASLGANVNLVPVIHPLSVSVGVSKHLSVTTNFTSDVGLDLGLGYPPIPVSVNITLTCMRLSDEDRYGCPCPQVNTGPETVHGIINPN